MCFLICNDFFPLWSTRKEKKKDSSHGVTPEFPVVPGLIKFR